MLVYLHFDKDAVTWDEFTEAVDTLDAEGYSVISEVEVAGKTTGKVNDEIVRRCDAIVLLGIDRARTNVEIEAYRYPDLPPISPTEYKYPIQVSAFMDKLMQMYRVHLKKNEDYSPANIMGAGQIGIATRLWDKTARLMNLMGFDIGISHSTYSQPTGAHRYESIEDNAMDLSVYGLIFQLYREGNWGR